MDAEGPKCQCDEGLQQGSGKQVLSAHPRCVAETFTGHPLGHPSIWWELNSKKLIVSWFWMQASLHPQLCQVVWDCECSSKIAGALRIVDTSPSGVTWALGCGIQMSVSYLVGLSKLEWTMKFPCVVGFGLQTWNYQFLHANLMFCSASRCRQNADAANCQPTRAVPINWAPERLLLIGAHIGTCIWISIAMSIVCKDDNAMTV